MARIGRKQRNDLTCGDGCTTDGVLYTLCYMYNGAQQNIFGLGPQIHNPALVANVMVFAGNAVQDY